MLAQVSFEQGLTRECVSGETMRQAIRRLGLNWKRVKQRITSPDPLYQQKNARDRLIVWASQQPTWAIGFADEV